MYTNNKITSYFFILFTGSEQMACIMLSNSSKISIDPIRTRRPSGSDSGVMGRGIYNYKILNRSSLVVKMLLTFGSQPIYI